MKLLIANRGEIACRVMRTARRMGIQTVAIYSDADARAPHVRTADEAVRIGPPPAAQSYLDIDAVIGACQDTGADAVHPGYGFLSENAAFSRALEAAGIIFVGPPVGAIEVMGDKIASKRFAAEAGVNTVPGHDGTVRDGEHAVEIAREVGLPVMLKASAGGGGKGMRVAHALEDVAEGFERARSEAASSFGDDRVFIERFVTDPRHIEIQVMADGHGTAVHLFERECSIQRRNQKVIEEAPSSFLDAQTRAEMGAQAVALAKAVDYRGAGTVEFIVNGEREFFFLEMNTRLQVEHPVTELVTGIDLVEWQLRVARGEPLGFAQDDLRISGHAIEARVYAEDPVRGFLPSIGRLTRYRPPAGEGVRVDDGVVEGSEISVHYDPMIAKLCTWAPTREAATERMADALDGFSIEGIAHNLNFLSALIAHPRWANGDLTTGLIAEEFPDGFASTDPGTLGDAVRFEAILAIAVDCEWLGVERRAGLLPEPDGLDSRVDVALIVDGERLNRHAVLTPTGCRLEGEAGVAIDRHAFDGGVWRGRANGPDGNGLELVARVAHGGTGWRVEHRGTGAYIRVLPPHVADLLPILPEVDDAAGANELRSPMPGTVVSIDVVAGEAVVVGQRVAVIEAMKMENALHAERDGTVAEVLAEAGAAVAVEEPIVRFEP